MILDLGLIASVPDLCILFTLPDMVIAAILAI